jgi:hypothetical protein
VWHRLDERESRSRFFSEGIFNLTTVKFSTISLCREASDLLHSGSQYLGQCKSRHLFPEPSILVRKLVEGICRAERNASLYNSIYIRERETDVLGGLLRFEPHPERDSYWMHPLMRQYRLCGWRPP